MHKGSLRTALMATAFLIPTLSAPTLAAQPVPAPEIFPPWQHGENNDATNRGFEFTVPQVDDLADFHGNITDPKLVLYVGGNYFFAMAPLVAEFEKDHPDYKGRIYWETIRRGCSSGKSRRADGEARRLPGWSQEGRRANRPGTADRTRGGLRHQHAHDYGAQRQPRARDRSGRSSKTRCPSRHAQPRIRGNREADRGVAEEGWRAGARGRGLQDQGGRRQHHQPEADIT
jgi:hypothetical protein